MTEQERAILSDTRIALGEALVHQYPHIKTGDEAPIMVTMLDAALLEYTRMWVSLNE
jgi:hypothetical protein